MKCGLKLWPEGNIRAHLRRSRVGPTSRADLEEGVSFEVLELLLEESWPADVIWGCCCLVELLNISIRRRGYETSEVAFESPTALGFLYPRAGIRN